MKKVVISFAVLSALATAVLLYLAFFPDFITEFWVFIGLGIMSIWAAISYTIGKKPYGYLGLGDIMVFIFFGLVSVGGSYFLFTKTWNWDILLPASAVGMLSVSVLNLNNMRDMESDQKAGKKTVAQWLGFRYAMIYHAVATDFYPCFFNEKQSPCTGEILRFYCDDFIFSNGYTPPKYYESKIT